MFAYLFQNGLIILCNVSSFATDVYSCDTEGDILREKESIFDYLLYIFEVPMNLN